MGLFKNRMSVLTCGIEPQSATDEAVDSADAAWVLPTGGGSIFFVCYTGASGTSATYQVEYGTDHDGANAASISGATVAHGADAAVSIIEVPVGKVPVGTYVGIKCTVVGTAMVAVAALAGDPNYSS